MSCQLLHPRAYQKPVFALFFVALLFGGMCPRSISADPEDQIGAGHIFFKADDGTKINAVHLGSDATITVNGFISHVELTQTFTNQTDNWQEAIYVLPLSDSAAVNEMEMQIGERIIRAEIQEKEAARKTYAQAKQAGKKAALVEQSRPNLFQQAVANIAPREKVVIHIRYVERVNYDSGEFSLRFPMTLTPRFIPVGSPPASGSEEGAHAPNILSPNTLSPNTLSPNMLSPNVRGWALPTPEVPDAHLITPPMTDRVVNPMQLRVSLDPGLELSEIGSTYHKVSVHRTDDRYKVSTVNAEIPMDRDFVLTWRPVVSAAPEAALFRETLDGEDYILLMVVPPEQAAEVQVLPRDMIFVIDTSGSMQGTSIEQAKASLIRALGKLRAQDRFNIIEFNSGWTRLFQQPQYPDNFTLTQARDWVARLSAGGGTNMLPALQTALAMKGVDDEAIQLRHIVFITDGAVGNEASLFGLIHNQLGETRLFPVGIGSAPNSYFMRQAAKHGRGTFTHIGAIGEVSEKMDALFDKVDSPVATNFHVEWPSQVESYPEKIPAVYRGEPLLIVAKGQHMTGDVHINGSTAHLPWRRTLSLDAKRSQPGVGTLWAREKIQALEDERVAGRDAALVRTDIIDVALAHKLVSRYTSLVAVEEISSRLPEEQLKTSAVPNQVPAGQVAQYPRTATNGPLFYLVGLLAALAGVLLQRRWA